MRSQRVSFRHACKLLLKDVAALATPAPVTTPNPAAKPNAYIRPAADWQEAEDDQRALDEAIGYYHETLTQSPEALEYLDKCADSDSSRYGCPQATRVVTLVLCASEAWMSYRRLPMKQLMRVARLRYAECR